MYVNLFIGISSSSTKVSLSTNSNLHKDHTKWDKMNKIIGILSTITEVHLCEGVGIGYQSTTKEKPWRFGLVLSKLIASSINLCSFNMCSIDCSQSVPLIIGLQLLPCFIVRSSCKTIKITNVSNTMHNRIITKTYHSCVNIFNQPMTFTFHLCKKEGGRVWLCMETSISYSRQTLLHSVQIWANFIVLLLECIFMKYTHRFQIVNGNEKSSKS